MRCGPGQRGEYRLAAAAHGGRLGFRLRHARRNPRDHALMHRHGYAHGSEKPVGLRSRSQSPIRRPEVVDAPATTAYMNLGHAMSCTQLVSREVDHRSGPPREARILGPERSAAWLAHQSGGLGVASSNLAAPTNEIKDLDWIGRCLRTASASPVPQKPGPGLPAAVRPCNLLTGH